MNGGARPGAGRPRKPDSRAAQRAAKKAAQDMPALPPPGGHAPSGKKSAAAPDSWPFGTIDPPPAIAGPAETASEVVDAHVSPLDYLLGVMRDRGADEKLRLQAAALAAPYVHAKKGEKKTAGSGPSMPTDAGAFGAMAPPRLVSSRK